MQGMSSTAEASAASPAAGSKPEGGEHKSCEDNTPSKRLKSEKRQQELNSSEQALLKARHLLQEIQNYATAVTATRLSSMLTILRNRSSDKMVQIYAEYFDCISDARH